MYSLEIECHEFETNDQIINNLRIHNDTNESEADTFTSCINWEHYSSFLKLVRHIAWILKLKNNYINRLINKIIYECPLHI